MSVKRYPSRDRAYIINEDASSGRGTRSLGSDPEVRRGVPGESFSLVLTVRSVASAEQKESRKGVRRPSKWTDGILGRALVRPQIGESPERTLQ